jgi:hypothetical protein
MTGRSFPIESEQDLEEARKRLQDSKLAQDAAAFIEVRNELYRACAMFPAFNSGHEGYAVILEELDELWTEVKDNKRPDAKRVPAMRKEATQVAAMAIRFMLDVCGGTSD